MSLFANRVEAGRLLADRLTNLRGEDVVVLGLPAAGCPWPPRSPAALDAPLDVIVVRKLGVPFQPELAMGAIGEVGARVLDTSLIRHAGITAEEVREVEDRERIELEQRVRRLRRGRPPVPLEGRVAVIVDDGLATGSTARVACQVARQLGAATRRAGRPGGRGRQPARGYPCRGRRRQRVHPASVRRRGAPLRGLLAHERRGGHRRAGPGVAARGSGRGRRRAGGLRPRDRDPGRANLARRPPPRPRAGAGDRRVRPRERQQPPQPPQPLRRIGALRGRDGDAAPRPADPRSRRRTDRTCSTSSCSGRSAPGHRVAGRPTGRTRRPARILRRQHRRRRRIVGRGEPGARTSRRSSRAEGGPTWPALASARSGRRRC